MQVLVIGGGGREHALVWKIKQSPRVKKIYCAPGNAGTGEIAENIAIAADDIKSLLEFSFSRMDASGNALFNSTGHYGLVNTDDGWKIQSMFFVNPITVGTD